MSTNEQHLMEIFSNACLCVWFCPVPGHGQRRDADGHGVVGVQWADGIAHCTAPRCGRCSADTVKHPDIHTLYLSGPMTGRPRYNYDAFSRAEARLTRAGYWVYNPADNGLDTSHCATGTEPVEGFDLRSAFAAYSSFISTEADAVAVLTGWQDSRGARAEVALAAAIGLPVLDAETGAPLNVVITADAG